MASISDVIHHPSIKLVSLWCPHPHASIRWVAVTEHLNPTPFLEGGELVLTTSCGSPKTEHQWEEYVERLNKAHVSALAFGVGPWQRQVPRELLTAAREHGLNLIEVPEATNFVRISRLVADLLEAEAVASARLLGKAQQSLIQAASSQNPLATIIDRLARITRANTALVTAEEVISAAGNPSPSKRILLETVQNCQAAAITEQSPTGDTIVLPTASFKGHDAYLVLQTQRPLLSWMRNAISTSALLLQTSLTITERLAESRLALSARCLELFLSGDRHTAREIYSLAYPRANRLAPKLAFVAAKVDRSELARAHKQIDSHFSVPLKLTKNRLQILVPSDGMPLLLSKLADFDLQAGIGAVRRQKEADDSAQTAELALKKTSPTRKQVTWDEISGNAMMALVGAKDARLWPKDLLAAANGNDEMLSLLDAFISTNGNIAQVAKETGMHRNTVRAKLGAAGRALAINLDDPAARAQLWFSLRARSER